MMTSPNFTDQPSQQIAEIELKSSLAFDEKAHWHFSLLRRICC